jgi:hypothetical protein
MKAGNEMATFKAETATMYGNASMHDNAIIHGNASMYGNACMAFGKLTGNHADTIAVDIRGYWLSLDNEGIYRAGCFAGNTQNALDRWSDDRYCHECHISRRILLAAVKATMGVNPIHVKKEESCSE